MANLVPQTNAQKASEAQQKMLAGQRLADYKWDWFVDGVNDPLKRSLTAIMAENQITLGGEHRDFGGALSLAESITESTTSSNIFGVNQILLPVIRRIYPYLMANNWVAIQPMLSPVSLIFYLRYYYAGNKSNTTAGSEFLQVPLTGDFGIDPYYSSQRNVIDATTAAALTTALNSSSAGFSNFPALNASVFLRAYSSGLALISEVQFQGIYGTNPSIPATPQRGSTANALVGALYNSSAGSVSAIPTVTGAVQYQAEWLYDQETAGDFNSSVGGIPELDVRIRTDAIQAEERKLKTQWTLEAAEDLKVLQNVDAERELVNAMAGEMLAEIDRQILQELVIGAANRANHDFIDDVSNNTKGNVIDRNQALAMKIGYLANTIHKVTRVAPANFLVTSPVVAGRLEESRGYVPVDVGDNTSMTYGIQAAGYLPGGKIRVFKDPLFRDDLILIGYKGRTFMDSGYFYAPYIPVKTTPVIYDPNTLQPRRGMITRYGTKMVDGGAFFYATLYVANILGNPS